MVIFFLAKAPRFQFANIWSKKQQSSVGLLGVFEGKIGYLRLQCNDFDHQQKLVWGIF